MTGAETETARMPEASRPMLVEEDHYAGERPNYLVLLPGGCTWVASRRLATRFDHARIDEALAFARRNTRRGVRAVPAPRDAADILDELRGRSWDVAVHNDYRIDGHRFTFWLLRRGDFAAKGEAATDDEAHGFR